MYSDMCEVLSLMASGILPAVKYYYLDMLIQIGLAVPLVTASVWDLQ